jgi:preprotein translocase subunit YajC
MIVLGARPFPETKLGDPNQLIQLIGLPLALFVLFYFLMIRPQQRRMKQHQEMLGGLKRGDNIVLSSGMMGKIVRVEDNVVGVEIATGVTVRVRKAMITEVEARGTPAPANDKV